MRLRAPAIRIRQFIVPQVLLILVTALAQSGYAQPAPAVKTPQSTDETVIIGTTTLRLGMSKRDVLHSLGIEYGVMAITSDREYAVMAKSEAIGFVYFNAQGSLVGATKVWTTESRPYPEGEIGSILVTLIASLIRDGNSTCTLEAVEKHSVELKDPQPPVPRHVYRDAMVKCGQKRIRISTTTDRDGADSIQIGEELGDPKSWFRD